MAERKTKFWNLRPDSLHTFVLRAWSLTGRSDPTDDIPIRTSGVLPIQWPSTAEIVAKPLYFFRCIRVTWTPLLDFSLRFSHYVLFRKDTTESEGYSDPTNAELVQSGLDIVNGNLDNNPHFLKETGKFPQHTDQVKLDASDTDTGVLEKHQYHYWVWAVDTNGQTSYMSSMGQGYLGPDGAEFGKPSTPIWPDPDRFETEVLIRNSWWCNIKVVWECVDGAEGYWIQTKEKDGWFWSLPFWVEHDPSKATDDFPHQQWVVLNNFLCNTEYQFKIQAINVPLILYSGWSVIETYLTEKDPYPPNEIMNVSAGRLRQDLIEKGEYINITWDWPVGAIILQQIEYFRMYKMDGTVAEATNYLATISAGTATPYTETLGGTQFIDDEVKELESEGGDGIDWYASCGFEGSDDAERRTIVVDGADVVGTLAGTANISNLQAQDGTYSLEQPLGGGARTITWVSGNIVPDLDQGYVLIYVWTNPNWGALWACWGTLPQTNDYIRLDFLGANAVRVTRKGDGTSAILNIPTSEFSGKASQWIKIETRWSVVTDKLEARVDDGTWFDYQTYGSGSMVAAAANTTSFRIGSSGGGALTYYDSIGIEPSYDGPAEAGNYYHYWVTAVDVDEQESEATMGESYDRVSFSPPAAATLRSPLTSEAAGFNLVQVLFWRLYTVKMTWDEVDEATHYRVKIKIKPPGVDQAWSDWMYSAHIEEAHANAGEPYPFFVYPIPLQKYTWIEWAVETSNLAGPTESDTSGEIEILQDTEPPSKPKTPIGRCYGITDWFGNKYWAVVVLTWQPNTAYQGVAHYAIFEDDDEIAIVPHNDSLISHFLGHQDYLRFGAEPVNAASHEYKIVAIGFDDVRSEVSDPVTIDYQEWWVM